VPVPPSDTCKRLVRLIVGTATTTTSHLRGMPRTATSISCSNERFGDQPHLDRYLAFTDDMVEVVLGNDRRSRPNTAPGESWHRSCCAIILATSCSRSCAKSSVWWIRRLPRPRSAAQRRPQLARVQPQHRHHQGKEVDRWCGVRLLQPVCPSIKRPHPHPPASELLRRDGGCKTAGDTELLKVPRGRLSVRRCGRTAVADGMCAPPAGTDRHRRLVRH
jgi:hypothetical protein